MYFLKKNHIQTINDMTELLKIAASQLGQKEIVGNDDNLEILKYWTETGILPATHDEVAWCSAFVNWCCKKAGAAMSGKANARSWTSTGKGTRNPKPGDVVVFWRGSVDSWKGHVGFFLGFNSDASRVFCLGGNQGDSVSVQAYDAKKVLGFRKVKDAFGVSVPKPILKKGSRGIEVVKLQNVLNHLHYSCGDADGDFGQKTFNALKLLQANNLITVDGEYGNESMAVIENLLQS